MQTEKLIEKLMEAGGAVHLYFYSEPERCIIRGRLSKHGQDLWEASHSLCSDFYVFRTHEIKKIDIHSNRPPVIWLHG